MGAGAGDERGALFTRELEEFEAAARELELLIDDARRLDRDQLKALIHLIRTAIAEQETST